MIPLLLWAIIKCLVFGLALVIYLYLFTILFTPLGRYWSKVRKEFSHDNHYSNRDP